jgi:hypothetical protein
MFSIKPGRGPSIQRAIGGLVAGLFGILWTVLAVALSAHASLPYVGVVFPLFGVVFTVAAWGQAAYHFIHATSQQRFAEYDFISQPEEPSPLPSRVAPGEGASARQCPRCQAELQATYRYCPQCGAKQ